MFFRPARASWGACVISALAIAACATNPDPDDRPASAVRTVVRAQERIQGDNTTGMAYGPRGEDGSVTAKVFAPAPLVWDALVSAMNVRKVNMSILDRGAGRLGDTALVLMRRWNDKNLSYYMNCGSNMTGARADQDRVKAVLLAQMSRLKADSIGIAVNFSAISTSIGGSSSSSQQCSSNGRAESEFLDEVIRQLGGAGKKTG